jgi:hypothetical protein
MKLRISIRIAILLLLAVMMWTCRLWRTKRCEWWDGQAPVMTVMRIWHGVSFVFVSYPVFYIILLLVQIARLHRMKYITLHYQRI